MDTAQRHLFWHQWILREQEPLGKLQFQPASYPRSPELSIRTPYASPSRGVYEDIYASSPDIRLRAIRPQSFKPLALRQSASRAGLLPALTASATPPQLPLHVAAGDTAAAHPNAAYHAKRNLQQSLSAGMLEPHPGAWGTYGRNSFAVPGYQDVPKRHATASGLFTAHGSSHFPNMSRCPG